MKILYVVPEGADMGGIITSTENIMLGFREAGHEATFCLLRPKQGGAYMPRGKMAEQFTIGAGTGQLMHPAIGWRGAHYGLDDPAAFVKLAKQHDVVVWGALYGLKNDTTIGSAEWVKVITGHKRPQVFMVRDDHLEARVPWAMAFAPYGGWAGVQPCSYDSAEGLGRRALVSSGHGPASIAARHSERQAGSVLALATWKPWKRGRSMLEAAIHLKKTKLTVAGDGIEFRYMRSQDKARDRDYLPDGRKIWDVAMKKVSYLGPIDEEDRDHRLLHTMFLLDTSLRSNSGQINRVVIEAMRHGAIPLCDPRFIDPTKKLFTPMKHYLPITADENPKTLASQIDIWATLRDDEAKKIREANLRRIKEFSRETTAQALVDLALACDTAIDKQKLARGQAAFVETFGGKLK